MLSARLKGFKYLINEENWDHDAGNVLNMHVHALLLLTDPCLIISIIMRVMLDYKYYY